MTGLTRNMLPTGVSVVGILLLAAVTCSTASAESLDLRNAAVVVRGRAAPTVEQTAATVLVEEVEKRTHIRWPLLTKWPENRPVIALTSGKDVSLQGRPIPDNVRTDAPEGYGIATHGVHPNGPVIWIVGADPRGALFGVGRLLRSLDWADGQVALPRPLNRVTAPALPIRGHQLGYRTTANSYDAWDAAQYEQYIRELTFFGVNCIENIPFQDRESPHMKLTRRAMNHALSAICDRYGMGYWVWTPVTFDLSDRAKRAALLDEHEAFYTECARLDAVFFPGGDPGRNPPRLLMPFLEDVAKRLAQHHPAARVWMSLQGFDDDETAYFFHWLTQHHPAWFGGAVGGPSSPPLPALRARLDKRYRLRDYPDITHTVRSQYPTAWIDPAFAFTLGREGPNPEPIYYRYIFKAWADYTDGFITYSDGIHDDANKIVWSALGWDPNGDVRDALIDYCRVFFGPQLAEPAADGLFALERNWDGPLATNGGVDATLALWQSLEAQAPHLADNWRWQLYRMRAYYDAYTRHRLIRETRLETEANAALADAETGSPEAAMAKALAILERADTQRCHPEWRARIFELCKALFESIGYQTSVEKYQASGGQRGAVLDFVDHPLNNRWWLEDEFAKVRALTTLEQKRARLRTLRTWEHPGPGSYYDDIGNVAKSDHVIRGEWINTDPKMVRNPNPDYMWWNDGKSRQRSSWISKMDWPIGLRYDTIDPEASYVVRTTGYGDCLLRVNGSRVPPTRDGRGVGALKEFPIPRGLYRNGTIVLTFDVPHEPGVNWRRASRLSEVWLLKQSPGSQKRGHSTFP